MESMQALLAHAVDYAGLFPPASLDLSSSLANYHEYRGGHYAWALGSLIIPASAVPAIEQSDALKTPVSVVLGPDLEQDLQHVSRMSRTYGLFECKLPHADRIAPILRELPQTARIFFEIDALTATQDTFAAIKDAGALAKVRTGGIVASAIPFSATLAGFLSSCAKLRLGFKATAGLHHPVRGVYRLTYESNPPFATMHGFVNVIVASALAWLGASEPEICAVLEETKPEVFNFQPGRLVWRDCSVSVEQLAEVRRNFFLGFGSCSFTEPIEESKALGWIA